MVNSSLFVRTSPFPATPDPRRYVPVGSIEQARVRLMRAIDRDEGPAVLVGPSGSGKSLLCQTLAAAYRNSMEVVMLGDAKLCTRRALLQMILFQLNMPYRDREEGELRLSLLDRLRPGAGEAGRDGLLLIVDEAQHLAPRLIDELRMIAGVVRDGRPRVRLVLAGNMKFEERLSEPALESLAQRVAARCYLHPMHLDETREYIREHLRRVGLSIESLMHEQAIQAVHQAAVGIPRIINQLMDQVVLTAEQLQAPVIDLRIVESAWAELNQLPAPYTDDESDQLASSASSSVVEFGALEEDAPLIDPLTIASTAGSTSHRSAVPSAMPLDPDATVFGDTDWMTNPESIVRAPALPKPELTLKLQVNKSCDGQDCLGKGCVEKGKKEAEQPAVIGNNLAIAFSALEDHSTDALKPVDAISFLSQPNLESTEIPSWSFLEESSIIEDVKPISSERPTNVPKLHRTKSAQTANALFGSDFDEIIELKQPMRVSSTGPLPWQGSLIDDANWLETTELDDITEGTESLHQQVLSLAHETRQEINEQVVLRWNDCVETPNVEDFAHDDRDILIVEEEVPSHPSVVSQVSPSSTCDVEYRDLFSRLRQG